ncbi:cupin domain-containing protein [Actinopolymorpha rutila]|uniref:JmjC domain-containing protein n=1 Tax=Actinopolymorpha rutila TaxID=446787 RepID=A0A852ZDU3_9ACTN|nr:cupin domain-containing protein [Actinopolymorpha rutila]NYH89998.1 hypothetical protein [Actinopolymorpha rutila]
MIGRFGLDRLLAPVTGKEFLEEHWEHTPLHVSRQDSSYFAELFTAHDVDDLLYGGGHVFTNLAAVEGSAGTERVLRGVPADDRSHRDGRVSLARIRALQAQGGTVLLHSVHRNVPRVGALAREVESALQCPVNVNMYLTPAHAQGFSAHFDDHDVFVVQIGGRKRWRLYPTVRELPLRFETLTRDAEDHQEPSAEYELCAGDTLYLPRGTIHEAFTDSDQPSLHLTIGLEVFRWADVLARAVRDCARDHLPLRRALPPGWVNDPAGTRAASVVPELLRAVADRVEAEAAVRALGGGFVESLPELPDGSLVHGHDADDLRAETLLVRRADALCQVDTSDGTAVIRYPGNDLRGPASIGPALRFVASTGCAFRPGDLPGPLTAEAKLVLARRLTRDRLLRVVRDGAGTGQTDEIPDEGGD